MSLKKKFILSDSSVNEYGFRLLTSGYQINEFAKNPIGYYMHKRDDGVALRWTDLAIEGDNVVGCPEINMSNSRGTQLTEEVANGFLNAASVGHIVVLEHSMDPKLMLKGQTGPTITKWYNKECSLVDIPGNCNALTNLFDVGGNKMQLADLMSNNSQNLNFNNMQIQMTPEALASLGLKAGATEAEINVAMMQLASKNNDLQLTLDQQKKEQVRKDIDAQLNAALGKKITAEFKVVLASQYDGKPEELRVMLAAMPAFQSVNTTLRQQERSSGNYTPVVSNLMAKGWDELDKTNKLKDLKSADPAAFDELYLSKFGYLPNQKPKPFGVDRDIANRG